MTQFASPTSAAADYDSTIIGALELSEKKWVIAVQLPGVKRHSRHVVEARGDELAAFVERLKARCAVAGHNIKRRRSPCNAAVEPSRGSAGATGKDGRDRRRDAATFAPHTLAFCVSGWRRCVRRRANARNYRDNSGDHKNRKYAAVSSCFVAEEALTLQRPQPDDALMIVARGGKKDEGGLAA
jgi:hypothetical protein